MASESKFSRSSHFDGELAIGGRMGDAKPHYQYWQTPDIRSTGTQTAEIADR